MEHPWPLFRLRVTTPRVELRVPDDGLLLELLAAARSGIHDPAEMPFAHPWTDTPDERFSAQFLQYHWGVRARTGPAAWTVDFVVVVDQEVVGCQGLIADEFATRRVVETGSWIRRDRQGAGIGREARAAVLAFAFAGLDARAAVSSAFLDNPASLAISHHLGYRENGASWLAPRGEARELRNFLLRREDWDLTRRDDIAIDGLDDDVRALLGAS